VTVLAFDPEGKLGLPLVLGLKFGSVYGLVALGLVLLYKSNGIFNFMQAEFGTIAAFVAAYGIDGHLFGISWKMPWLVAVVIAIAFGTLVSVGTELLVVRPLFRQPKVILVVGTVGVLLTSIAIESLVFPTDRGVLLPAVNDPKTGALKSLADPAVKVSFANYRLPWAEVVPMVALVVMALAAVAFFRFSRQGTAILAVSQEPTAAQTVGISIRRVSLLTWTLAGFLGAVAGIVGESGTGALAPGILTGTALLGGIAAAVLGGITSLPGAFLGGLLVGVLQQIAQAFFTFPGAQNVLLGVVLLVVLLIRPAGLLGKST